MKKESPAAITIIHHLPHRTRLSCRALLLNRPKASILEKKLFQAEGIKNVQVNTRTGHLLVHHEQNLLAPKLLNIVKDALEFIYQVEQVEEEGLFSRATISLLEPEDRPIFHQVGKVIAVGALLLYLWARRAALGPSSLASSGQIFTLTAITTLLAGYPNLNYGLRRLTGGGRVNHDLFIGLASLILLFLGEGFLGLVVIWLTNFTDMTQAILWRETKNYLSTLGQKEIAVKSHPGRLAQMAAGYAEKEALMALLVGSLSGIAVRDFRRTLSVLLAANPSPAGLVAPTALAYTGSKIQRQGIRIKHPEVLPALASADILILSPSVFPREAGNFYENQKIISRLNSLGTRVIIPPPGKQPTHNSPGPASHANQDLVRLVNDYQKKGWTVAVFGAGEEDVPAMMSACVSMAPGQGTGKALAACDLIVPGRGLSSLYPAFKSARLMYSRAGQSLTLVGAANILGMILGASGLLSPVKGAIWANLTSIGTILLNINSPGAKGRPMSKTKPVPAAATLEPLVESPGGNRFSLALQELSGILDTDPKRGLGEREAKHRLSLWGANRLPEEKEKGLAVRIAAQMQNFLVKMLLGASGICLLLGQGTDALAICSIILVNALLGAIQEQKAAGAMAALYRLATPTARTIREGHIRRIAAVNLVPGDIVLLEQGDGVPADIRLLEASFLEAEESLLTGESCPVPKEVTCAAFTPKANMVFQGTSVTRGRATGVVVATGPHTEMGKIAGLLRSVPASSTALQKTVTQLGRTTLRLSLLCSSLVVLLGIIRGGSPVEMFLTGVSLAVAAIPEGLPAVVTMAMAVGVKRISRHHAIIRHLPVVETLGSATVICLDKTGTLTMNSLKVESLWSGGRWCRDLKNAPFWSQRLLAAALLASENQTLCLYDPLEQAILDAASQCGLDPTMFKALFPKEDELPFFAENGLSLSICGTPGGRKVILLKGAPEKVMEHCNLCLCASGIVPLDLRREKDIQAALQEMAGHALKVVAVAFECQTKNMIFLGLIGMGDPPRPEAQTTVSSLTRAGLRIIMMTGDHPATAAAIACKIGLIAPGGRVLTAGDLEQMDNAALRHSLAEVNIFARLLPAHKLRLIRALKEMGETVVMIGDGINDAPAMRAADAGIAMGRGGTQVIRETADMILTDDNLACVLPAIKEGRGIHQNVRRSVNYLLGTNAGEVMFMFLALLLGFPSPLLPIQLLWLNLMGDGFPALAMALAKAPPRIIEAPHVLRGPAEDMNREIVKKGLLVAGAGLSAYGWAQAGGKNTACSRSIVLSTITLSQLGQAIFTGIPKGGKEINPYLLGASGLSAGLLGAAIYLPPLRSVFKTTPLGLTEWIFASLAASLSVIPCLGQSKRQCLLLTAKNPKPRAQRA